MKKFLTFALLNIFLVYGEIYIQDNPSIIKFTPTENPLHVSELPNLFAATLGYSFNNFNWPGLAVTCPVGYPTVAAIFVINDAANLKLSGLPYKLSEDVSFNDIYDEFEAQVNMQSQRSVSIEYIQASELDNDIKEFDAKLDLTSEMSVIKNLPDYLQKKLRSSVNGQQITFVSLDSFSDLVKEHDRGSAVVEDGARLFNETLSKVISDLTGLFPDRVFVSSVILSEDPTSLQRTKRQAFGMENSVPKQFQNIGATYGNDFPVVFNMVLILSIILVVSLIAASVSIAFMDPGRDSIIYRMTNPRMKKDQ